MDPERSGQQGGGQASYVPIGNSSGVRSSRGGNKSTSSGVQGNRGGLEIKVVHTNVRTGKWLVSHNLK